MRGWCWRWAGRGHSLCTVPADQSSLLQLPRSRAVALWPFAAPGRAACTPFVPRCHSVLLPGPHSLAWCRQHLLHCAPSSHPPTALMCMRSNPIEELVRTRGLTHLSPQPLPLPNRLSTAATPLRSWRLRATSSTPPSCCCTESCPPSRCLEPGLGPCSLGRSFGGSRECVPVCARPACGRRHVPLRSFLHGHPGARPSCGPRAY